MFTLETIKRNDPRSIIADDPLWPEVIKHGYRLDDPETDYKELIDLSMAYLQHKIPATDPAEIERIRGELCALPHADEFFHDPIFWPRLAEALKDPGVSRMFHEEVTDGLHSEFLAPSYALMPSAVTLEMPFLHCINLQLEMAEVTDADPYHRIALVEEGYQYTRIRTATTAKLLTDLIRKKPHGFKAVILNCGQLLEFRYFPELREAIMASDARIYCNDTDGLLDLAKLIPDPNYRWHFTLTVASNLEVLENWQNGEVDIVASLGHAIYTYKFNANEKALEKRFKCDYLKKLIALSLGILEKSGIFLFDLQPGSLEWQKLILSLTWLRNSGMRIALPPPDDMFGLFVVLCGAFQRNLTAYDVPVQAARGPEVAGHYMVFTN